MVHYITLHSFQSNTYDNLYLLYGFSLMSRMRFFFCILSKCNLCLIKWRRRRRGAYTIFSLSLSIQFAHCCICTICYVRKINWTEFYQYGICHMMILIWLETTMTSSQFSFSIEYCAVFGGGTLESSIEMQQQQ